MSIIHNCKVCEMPLTGRQRSFCSEMCKNRYFQDYDRVKERANKRKLELISLHGGGCERCGYKASLSALSFYDKSGETLHIEINSLANNNYEKLQQKVQDATVLCRNCYEELHNPQPRDWRVVQTPRNDVHLSKKFERNLGELGLSGQTIVLGVSGGVDSVVMLDLFVESGFKPIVAHMNHGVRAEAKADEGFVRDLAKKHGLKFISKAISKPKSGNLEEKLRNARREFLLSAAKNNKAGFVALAHNTDDQAETILMNLVRGSSSAGLGGMKPIDGQIVRPLLDISRAEIEAYAFENKLEWHEDITNQDISYSRNYVRHQILPKLARINPEYLANIGRSAMLQREINAHFARKAAASKSVHNLDKPVLYEYLGQQFETAKGNRKDLSLEHLKQLESLIAETSGTKSLDLPGNIVATRTYDRLDFTKKKADNMSSVNKVTCLALGENVYGDFVLTVDKNEHKNTDNYSLRISEDLLNKLVIRNRKPGDRIDQKGMKGRKKLQDLFVDAKIDREKRDRWPILADIQTDEIIWIPGLAKSKNYIEKGTLAITAREDTHETQETK